MNDLRFAALIKEGGKTAGLSEEEIGNYLIRLFQNSPDEFINHILYWINYCHSK